MDKESSSGSKRTVVIVAIVVVLVVLVGAWYLFMYKPEQEAKEKARVELIAKAAAKKKRAKQAAKKKADYDLLITKADGEFEQESWEAAQVSYSSALSLFSKKQYPQNQLTLVNEKLDEIIAMGQVGTVESVSSATGRFFVVVSSSIDGDLAMDYANKLAADGQNVKIIEPYGSKRFHRVSLGDYDALDKAVRDSDSFSTTDGSATWILKY